MRYSFRRMPERPLQLETAPPAPSSPLALLDRHIASWDWSVVIGINQHLCRKGSAQHGLNPDSHSLVAADWEVARACSLPLLEIIDHLHRCHRREPFFFFNESTFTRVSRELCSMAFASLSSLRRREATTAVVRYVAGLLERPKMIEVVEAMWWPLRPEPGDRVRTLRGSLVGTALGIGLDGRIHWQPDCANVRVITLPELLMRMNPLPDRSESDSPPNS
jgi:hypothetical protein